MKHHLGGAAGFRRARGISIAQLTGLYRQWASEHYTPSEVGSIQAALRPLDELFGPTRAVALGPVRLRQVRQAMIDRGWNRAYCNKQIQRVCAIFRWAVSHELLAENVYARLKSIEPLKRRRCAAPEPVPVGPAEAGQLELIRELVSPQVWAVIELQRLTGARPGEILGLKAGDVDRSEKIWRSALADHKTEHHGRKRTIHFGPRAQMVLSPWLLRPDQAYLFSPREAEEKRIRAATQARRTPLGAGHRATGKRRAVGDRYTRDSYRRAINRACKKAGIPTWHPNQLRHLAATEIRKQFGLIEAQLVLGHASAVITDGVYAERDQRVIDRVMWERG